MSVETLDLSTHFKTKLYTWDSFEPTLSTPEYRWDSFKPEMTLDFDGFGVESSIDLTVEQAKKLILQLQKFVALSK